MAKQVTKGSSTNSTRPKRIAKLERDNRARRAVAREVRKGYLHAWFCRGEKLGTKPRGCAPVYRPPRPAANLSTPEAGRVVRALLANDPGRRWTQRGMQEHIGELQGPAIAKPSIGLANKVVRNLREEAFIEVLDDGGFRLRDPLKLLYAWRDAYRFDRHDRHDYSTLLRGAQLREALYKHNLAAGGAAAYASFSAAGFQAPHIRQPNT